MRFADRREAGERLARVLASYLHPQEDACVVALPRGGVAVAAPIARFLNFPIRVLIVRKVGMPHNPEAAVCALAEEGVVVCDEDGRERVPPEWLASTIELAQQELAERSERLAPWRIKSPPPSTAIVVDDGAATGLTILAAIAALREKGVARVVVALPVAPLEVGHLLRTRADEVVILHESADFLGAVSAYYDHFPQLSDEEVMRLLTSVQPS